MSVPLVFRGTPAHLPPPLLGVFAPGAPTRWPGELCSLLLQLVKKLSDLTGCTQVVDIGSGQVGQTPNGLGFGSGCLDF